MSTINPFALTVVTAVQPTGGGTHETVTLASCYDCGAIIINAETHRTACPRLKPERPEPITPDRHEWAKIVHAHRKVRTIEDDSEGIVRCTCGNFSGAPFGHSQHVAAMIANYVEANR
ncbi:hypothetical protein NLX62_00335 [Mycobacteriaceae bacterium Msp059]|nr:hypothetical protein [Mycobacteriaceae bacterium Msp059]